MGISRTVSETNGDFGRKSRNFATPVYLKPPLSEFCLEFCNGGSTLQKTESCPTRRWEEFDD